MKCIAEGRFGSVVAAQGAILKEKCVGVDGNIHLSRNIDLSQLPPCQEALHQHIRRANYQITISKATDISQPRIPQGTGGYGWTSFDSKLQPLWFQGLLISSLQSDDEFTY